MKKLLFGLIAAGMLTTLPVIALEAEGILDNHQIIYSPSAKTFATGGMAPDRIVLTKKTSEGTGNYSSYSYKVKCTKKSGNCKCGCALKSKKCTCNKSKAKKEIELNSNYEFITENRLIGVDNENLNYYEVTYENGDFKQNKLTVEDVEKIFKDAEIVKISDFNKGNYTVIANDTKKEILLFNDTDANFHKYSVSPKSAAVDKNIKGLIQLPKKGKIRFNHQFNKKEQKYTIKVK